MKRTITSREALQYLRGLRHARATNGLVSVKLTRTRKLLYEITEPVRKAFDEIGQRYAVMEDDKPVVELRDGLPANWILTGTPFYTLADTLGFASEMEELMAETHEVETVTLSESNLASISVDAGDEQSHSEAALAWLAE